MVVSSLSVSDYHRELVRRQTEILGERLVGVYATGSFALGDFAGNRSDLDVLAVCRDAVTAAEKRSIVEELRHESFPCPARGLEFVLYLEATARTPSTEADFLLNLNTGSNMAFRVDTTPGTIERHWLPLDREIARTAGVALVGPSPRHVFAAIPRRELVPIVRESLEWHLVSSGRGDDAVLNACRSLRWLREAAWSSKSHAGAWALERVDDPELVKTALRRRDCSAQLGAERISRFVRSVLTELDGARSAS